MIKRTILYYPTINIPTNSWLRHSLLYWDELSSIVPQSWDNKYLSKLSPDINYLLEEGHFRPIKPDELIRQSENWEALEEFEKEFMEIIQSPPFKKFIKSKPFRQSKLHIDKVRGTELVSRIHSNKTSGNLYHFLRDLGFASVDKKNGEWYLFENHVALIYMSLLAKYLANVDKKQTTIGTDFKIYEKFNFKRVNETEGFPVVSLNLSNILPSPVPNVPLEKIIDFKNNRQDELYHFRKILMDFQIKISKAQSNQELKEISVSFQEAIQVGIKGLSDTLKDFKIETVSKSLKSLISVKSPAAWLSAAAIADEKFHFLQNPISLQLKIIGIVAVGMIELHANYIEVRNKKMAKTRESAFSYLLQAQKAGILKANP